ncbi:ABC transporter substrate-binding protein [Corynebacterium variabile]
MTIPLRRLGGVLTGIALVGGLAACGSSDAASDSGLTRISVGLPWNGGAGSTPRDTGPFGYAESLGLAEPILEKHGFEFDRYVGFNNGPPVIQALQSGDITLGNLGDVPSVQARGNGQTISPISVDRPTSGIWFLTNDPALDSIEKLKGRKVGLQFGSNFDRYGRAALDRHGALDNGNLVNLLFADALPALQKGSVSAVAVPANTAAVWLENNDFTVASKAEIDDPDLLSTGVSVTTDQFREDHPEISDAYWEVEQAGIAEIRKDLDKYIDWASDQQKVSANSFRVSNTWNFSDERVDPDGVSTLKNSLAFLVDQGIVKKPFDIDEWVNS